MSYKVNGHERDIIRQTHELHLHGDIVPECWYKHITFANGKPNFAAVLILARVCGWYRPVWARNEVGDFERAEKLFKGDRLQVSYQQLADHFGFSRKTAKGAVDVLVEHGLIIREFRTLNYDTGPLHNVMYVEPVPAKIRELQNTQWRNDDPEMCPDDATEEGVVPSKVGGSTVEVMTYTATSTTTSIPDQEKESIPTDGASVVRETGFAGGVSTGVQGAGSLFRAEIPDGNTQAGKEYIQAVHGFLLGYLKEEDRERLTKILDREMCSGVKTPPGMPPSPPRELKRWISDQVAYWRSHSNGSLEALAALLTRFEGRYSLAERMGQVDVDVPGTYVIGSGEKSLKVFVLPQKIGDEETLYPSLPWNDRSNSLSEACEHDVVIIVQPEGGNIRLSISTHLGQSQHTLVARHILDLLIARWRKKGDMLALRGMGGIIWPFIVWTQCTQDGYIARVQRRSGLIYEKTGFDDSESAEAAAHQTKDIKEGQMPWGVVEML